MATNNMGTNKERLVQWLRDAYAMEEQAESMLSAQVSRLENYPDLRSRIRQHLEETRDQASRIERCLDQLQSDRSSTKDLLVNLSQPWTHERDVRR
jgi:ferritin-like metal-binding protein YciE